MVLIHYKNSEKNQFLIELKTSDVIGDVVREIVRLNNARVKLDRLIRAVKDMAEHGPLKPEALRGLTTPETIKPAIEMLKENEKKFAFPKANSNERENPDKTGFRTGIAPKKEIADKMLETIDQIAPLLSD